MTPPPARVLTASALTVGVLLASAACSALTSPPTAERPDLTATTTSAAPPEKGRSPGASPALTPAQAQAALITDTDLGEAWTPTQGAATWHDVVLKATTDRPDCRRLLDTLYAEEPFGADARPRAVLVLDEEWNQTQLRQQVVARPAADVDRTLAWLRTLPKRCARFTAKTGSGAHEVEVTEATLPRVGDNRQGLRLVVSGETADGEPASFTLDVAAVRVGDDAMALTYGGFGEVYPEVTQAVVQLAAQRLTEVRKQGRVEV
ncbi:hypothetical protein [Streptomyces resistomycificus]|uniref:Lipoprotein n=1 Tax=Streptomyces resistomycificus TaxID=67356 RepID=A0A0L8KY12_9ACTN|nr:hypothetical protein [Streptomyces resistomycificus]KOG30735.1 hypothetical protein ADK37_33560 [Streptomyces resistomycificus]KUN97669.1 hypothetical protein AQJ84_16245 [Streptomyces resistomycificus]